MAVVGIVGCGYVGQRLAEVLHQSGHRVFGVRRSKQTDTAYCSYLQLDISRPINQGELPRDLTHLVYMVSAGEYSHEAYQRAYVQGVENILDAVSGGGHKLSRLLFVSSTGVYGQSAGEWVDEESPTEPLNFSGKLLLEGERIASRSGIPSVILRFSGIYGPSRDRMVRLVREKASSLNLGEDSYTNRIHLEDCASSVQHLLFEPSAEGIYIASDDAPVRRAEVLSWISDQLGESPAVGDFSYSPSEQIGGKRCSNGKLKSSGYSFKYPTYREGYAEIILSS